MEKYYNDYNTVLRDPTPEIPYVEAASSTERGYGCPKTDLINVTHELPRKAINIYFEHATPEYNYACHLEEGSPVIWDVSFVREGKLIKISGVVDKIEYHADKYNGRVYTHTLNGVIPPEDEVVVRFDCSIDNKANLVSINIQKIRQLIYSKANLDDESEVLVLPKDSYAYFERTQSAAYQTIITGFSKPIDGTNVLVGDYCFANMVELKKINSILSFPKMITADFMFNNTKSLTAVDFGSFDKLETAEGFFDGAKSVTSLSLEMPKVKNLDYAFKDCESLQSIELNAPSLESATGIFKNCNQLKTVSLPANSVNCDLEILSPVLTDDSITNILKALKTDRSDLEKLSQKRYITFCNHTLCPTDAVTIAVNAIVKGGWTINGLYTEDGSLENLQTPSGTDESDKLDLDKEYSDNLVDLYKDLSH